MTTKRDSPSSRRSRTASPSSASQPPARNPGRPRPQKTVPEIKAFHALISGRVQGVGFRYCALHQALRLNITGYVRNLDDGDVEVLAEGREPDISAFIAWLYEGPPGAWIQNVSVSPEPVSGFASFEVDYY